MATPERPQTAPQHARRELIRRLPEGEGAGPGAPETVEPVQGRPGAGGHGPASGPVGPAMLGLGRVGPSEEEGRQRRDDLPDLAGALAFLSRAVVWAAVGVARALPRPGRRVPSARP